MVFSSNTFLFCFLPICLSGYYLLRDNHKNIWLFIMSLLFYGWSSIKFLPIIGISIVLNYSGGYLVNYAEKYPNKRIKKMLCFLIICINILLKEIILSSILKLSVLIFFSLFILQNSPLSILHAVIKWNGDIIPSFLSSKNMQIINEKNDLPTYAD